MRYPDVDDQRLLFAAFDIQRRHLPYWLLLYGPHSRRIWAYPRFDVPPGTLLADADPVELEAQMSAIETTYLRRMP